MMRVEIEKILVVHALVRDGEGLGGWPACARQLNGRVRFTPSCTMGMQGKTNKKF